MVKKILYSEVGVCQQRMYPYVDRYYLITAGAKFARICAHGTVMGSTDF